MAKLIIFDLDGTLLNTLQDLTNSVNYAMKELNLPLYTTEEVRAMVGNGVSVLMKRAVTKRHADLHGLALTLQRKYYNEHINDYSRPYDGIVEMLTSLKQRGFIIAVHSNKDENCAKALCEEHFGELVDYVCGTTDYTVTKPNPIKILSLMESLDICSHDVVYCGDSEVDIKTAFNAGIKCISVTWGFRDKQFLIDSGASNIVCSPERVEDVAAMLVEAC